MAVKAKFKCEKTTQFDGGSGEAFLTAVTGGSEENKEFWKCTPAGEIRMHIDNPDAMKQFKPGMQFYVTFEPAKQPE